MENYELQALRELKRWQIKMTKRPSLVSGLTKGLQNRVNNLIPEKVHITMTAAIKNMVHAVLIGSEYTTRKPLTESLSLEEREALVLERVKFYKKAAAVEGAGTGAGGIFLGLADFPLLLTLKMKFLFDSATLYGYDIKDYRERIFILHLFQLAFSSDKRRNEVYQKVLNWQRTLEKYPPDVNLKGIDWRKFQQEYRDYIDLIKMLQMIPGIGAVVGAWANFRFLDTLGETAMNAYRLRYFQNNKTRSNCEKN